MITGLLDFIAGPESGGRYDVAYGGATLPQGLTLGQAIQWARQHGKNTGSSAIGRYQFLASTLQDVAKDIDPNTPFTPQLQDQLATRLLERRGLSKYQAGELSPDAFARNLSKEWAGLPAGPHGRSYYHGDKMGNKAGVSWEDTLAAVTGTPSQAQPQPQPKATEYNPLSMTQKDLKEASSMEKGLTNPYSMLGLGLLGVLGGPFGVLALGAMNYGQTLKKERYAEAGIGIEPPEPTALMQNVAAAGFIPGTPEYQQIMQQQLKQVQETALEQQLIAAGYQPGTPEFTQAIERYLFTPKSSVTVNNNPAETYLPQGALAPVDKNDATKGYLYPDSTSPTGTKVVKPTGATQATEGEVKAVGSLNTVNDSLNSLEQSLDKGARIDGVVGIGREFIEQPSLLGGAARFGLSTVDKFFDTDFSNNKADRQALVAMEQIRAFIGQYISGADVPQEQIENFKKWMPAPGDDTATIKIKLGNLRSMVNTIEEAGKLRQRETRPQESASPQASAPMSATTPLPGATDAEKAKLEEIKKRWGFE